MTMIICTEPRRVSVRSLALGAVSAVMLASCSTLSVNEMFFRHDVPRRVAFVEADFAPASRSGSGTVEGHDFLTNNDDSIEDAANAEIQLFPVTAYTTEFVQREFVGGVYLAPPDPRYLKYVRTTHADAHGNFRFSNLPPGDYYLGGRVYFMGTSSTQYDDGSSQEFHELCYTWNHARVSVRDGQVVTVDRWISGPERIKHS